MQEGLFGQDDLMSRSTGMCESDEARSWFSAKKKRLLPEPLSLPTLSTQYLAPCNPPPSRT